MSAATTSDNRGFIRKLTAWYRRKKRDLPWRRDRNAYAIWVSEVMLQQTTVAAVIPFYERFLTRFPTVAELAAADGQDVLRLWAGLGYYSRARNLHAAAKEVVARFGGVVPNTVADLLSLPGIGRYTAGAVASFAFDVQAPILDTNVARVLARLYCVPGDPKLPTTAKVLWGLAESLVPARKPGEFNYALMELGATLCSPAAPDCARCPIRANCAAHAAGRPTDWPHRSPKAKSVSVHEVAVVATHGGKVLVAQRKAGDLWAGMWEFPRGEVADGESADDAAVRVAREKLHLAVTPIGELPTIRHGVTFRSIRLDARLCRAHSAGGRPDAYAAHRWLTPEQAAELPHSSPQAKLLRNLQAIK